MSWLGSPMAHYHISYTMKHTKLIGLCFAIAFMSFSTALHAQLQSLETSVSQTEKMNYLLYTPPQQKASYPLMVFLHGGGEGGDDIELVKKHGPPKLIAQGRDFPFYMFAPQNPYKKGLWDDQLVDKMVDKLVDSLNIDTTRIYLVGMSRGGYGVWQMAINHPDKYAAMISVCAATIPMVYVTWISPMPVWLFHGEKDELVPVEQTVEAYKKMKPTNPNVKLTLYPEAKHNSWIATFENEAVYQWLLSQSKK